MDKTVIELFAGVGGFRVGLNKVEKIDRNGVAIENGPFNFVWANQWEPSTKTQHAYECYKIRFNSTGDECSNVDISLVDKKNIPNHTLLCGGFPCQDYSVAHSKSKEKGIEGKKGVLWWQIDDILKEKKPSFVLLENVDRLLKSPSKQRGRDFAIMLRCFEERGYAVEWRVINAADYGLPQRRRRIFIFASRRNTKYYKKLKKLTVDQVINKEGIFAKKFPLVPVKNEIKSIDLLSNFNDLVELSNKFNTEFENSGYMLGGKAYTVKIQSIICPSMNLCEIIEHNVDSHYLLNDKKIEQYKILRNSKKILRTAPDGSTYFYSEGSMSPYDSLDLPGRTMLTSEGTTNRSTHIILDPEYNKLRILTPIECERLNQFPDDWTNTMCERKRYFMMGNALVCGIISKLGDEISLIIDKENA